MNLKNGEFHANNGFTFRRVEGFGRATDGQPIAIEARVYAAGGHEEGALLERMLLTESELASIVAHLSRRGETGDTFREALAFIQQETR